MSERVGARGWAVRRIHNACVVIEIGDVRVLTDPWFSNSRAFVGAAPVTAAEVGELTAVIGSHWVKDHWNVADLSAYPDREVPLFACAQHMVDAAVGAGFANASVVSWGQSVLLSDRVRLEVIEEHEGRGKPSNNYALVSDDARLFFGGEVLDLDAVRRHAATSDPYDVVVGPVNGVRLMGRQLTATAAEMLEACRILGADTLIPIHDEHRPIPLLLKVTSSARDYNDIGHADVRIVALGFGERVAVGR